MKKVILTFLTVILFITAGCSTSTPQLREVPRSERLGLVVLNFTNNTPSSRAPEFQPWEFGLASMIMTDLETVGIFNIIGKERLDDVLKEQQFQMSGMVREQDLSELGELVGAKYILAGTFMEMNGSMRIESQVISVEKGTQLGTASVTGNTESFFQLVKELFVEVSRFLNTMLTEDEEQVIAGQVETKSVEASLNNYKGELAVIEAEELKKAGKESEAEKIIETAEDNFKKALEYDPEYNKAKENLSRISLTIPVSL